MSVTTDIGTAVRKWERVSHGMSRMRRQGCHALGIVGALLASPAYAALPETIGRVEGVSEDSSGAVTVRGWACFRGWSWSSPQVDLYAGSRADSGGTKLGTYWTDQPSEPELSEACKTTGQAHRFRITLNISMRQQYAGQRIYIYGHAYPTNGASVLLDSSGQYTIPAAPPSRDTLTYIHTDRLGSSVILTDEKANIVTKTNYKAYGGPTQNEQKPEAPGYTGHYEDPLTGLTYMQARYYDADLGVFLSIDPMPTTPGNLYNFGRYGYANANPLSFIDPDGRVAMAAVWLDGYAVSGGGGSGREIFFRPPSDNWWHDIERPGIGDFPGLIGGGGGNLPSKPTDLEGIVVKPEPVAPNVTWHGTVWAATVGRVGVSGARYVFTLTSDCVEGRQALARVSAVAFGGGFGAVASNTGSFVTFETGSPQLNPQVFVGPLVANNIGLAVGVGYGVSSYKLGQANSPRSGSVAMGFDAGVGVLAGDSVLEWSNSYSCGK